MQRAIWIAAIIVAVSLFSEGQRPASSLASVESLIRSQQYDQALQATDSELRTSPKDFRFWTLKGIILSLKGNTSSAISSFETARKYSPDYIPALKAEVQLLYRSVDKRAIPLLMQILKIDPNDRTAHEMLGTLERKAENCSAAIEQLALAKDSIATHPESLESYGYCLVQMQQYEQAVPVFEKLVALFPNRAYPKYDLAVVLVAAKQYDAARQTLDPLLTSDQQDTDILSLASLASEALGDTPKAVTLLRQAIVLSPTTVDYYVEFAQLCLDHDSFQVGIDMTNAGIRRVPSSAALYLSRGLLYAQLAQYDKAEEDFGMSDQLDSKQSLSLYARDLAEAQRNNPDEALAEVRSQLKVHPENPLLNFLLAKLIMNQTPEPGSAPFNEAMNASLLAIKMKPDLVDARDTLASMYMSSGQYDLAIEQSRLSLQYAPSDETAMYHLVISLRHTGHKDDLQALVKRLSELHQQSLKQETDRKRYRLVEETPFAPDGTGGKPLN
jgi:tetratricopeptide (TPR) repeat protein